MKFRNLKEMTHRDAVLIWKQHGVDPSQMDQAQMKLAHRKLIMAAHPDRPGGSNEDAQQINAAYDELKRSRGAQGADSGWTGARYKSQERQNQQNSEDDGQYPVWAQAGWSGGMKETGRIYRNDYTDINYFKKRMWELNGKKASPATTIWGYDGAYFRGSTTVYGGPAIYDEMAKAMIEWQTKGGNPYRCRAVFVCNERSRDKTIQLVYCDGKFFGSNGPILEYDSFNKNPGNDQQFQQELPGMLDEIMKGGEVLEAVRPMAVRNSHTGSMPDHADQVHGFATQIEHGIDKYLNKAHSIPRVMEVSQDQTPVGQNRPAVLRVKMYLSWTYQENKPRLELVGKVKAGIPMITVRVGLDTPLAYFPPPFLQPVQAEVKQRYEQLGWTVQFVQEGNHQYALFTHPTD